MTQTSITKIEAQGLFGIFAHSITLERESRVAIIHGPNGFGKTVMLGMLHGFLSGDMQIFQRVPFEAFRIHFQTGQILAIRPVSDPGGGATRKKPRKLRQPEAEISYELQNPGEEPQRLARPSQTPEPSGGQLAYLLAQIDREAVPGPFSLHGTRWLNSATGVLYSLRELMDILPNLREHHLATRALRMMGPTDPEEVTALRKELSPSFFIKTQRLSGTVERKVPPYEYESVDLEGRLSVESYSAELASLIQNALADYGKHSQQLDRSFPARFVQFLRDNSKALDDATILERLRDLDARRTNLMRIGFLEREASLGDLGQADVTRASQALTIYVDDVAKKLSVFDDIEKRVTLFMDIINERFLHKRLDASREEGFIITSLAGKAKESNGRISLRDLSSGEQHELVVVFELLFKVKRGALILIDEPEISLHVAWQSKFIDDLLKILEVNDGFALVATHSPVIIGERWDLTQRLENPPSLASTGRE